MKNSVIYLGLALVTFANVSMAANHKTVVKDQIVLSIDEDATPLNVAISKGDIDGVKKFIEYGANVNEQSGDMSPLMTAARYNKVEIIKVLLASGARPSDKNERGYTALKYAQLSNATDAVALLKDLK
ncbi:MULTISPECIES: ankyrin repeat domain-containing protein [Flavobacterium]|jgi:ankyrin repeat protein|uniref:Ankyrin repeat domain-containing protein n=1 Tax=Flavobacterium cupriresistens TaxID=2893885 RepID=A0ABU4RCQ2_9FLAO|nr:MULTISPECIES: ankyrin repeat domain-containing protein [unclassified Flavobacterium]KLT69791.1 ankyrin [Flavobacterium sp. ABG]MDX6189444.1 ankyrin repeat domain-containing protein [Flavobacterium sp. Fl-318]UFH41146.1 ankyrin repeat domain-containing protein [Flavobacterium sp. F-323]